MTPRQLGGPLILFGLLVVGGLRETLRPGQSTACSPAFSAIRICKMNFPRNFLLLLLPLFARAAEIPSSRHDFIVIAHRGDHRNAHENTLTALQKAIDAGVDYAEIDVRRTLDGHHVLMHDRTVDRMTDGHGAVEQLTLSQIQELHVHDLKRPQIPSDRIPTFTETLQLINGRLNIYLDFKDGDRLVVAKA